MESYAVIGPRTTPEHYNVLISKITSIFEDSNYQLRTTGVEGFEAAALNGVDFSQNKTVFNELNSKTGVCKNMAWDYYRKWKKLSEEERTSCAYTVQAILGEDFKQPVNFLITYTEEDETIPEVIIAMRLAREYGIRVFDLSQYSFHKLYNDILIMQENKE